MSEIDSETPKPLPGLRNAGRAKSCTRCRQAKLACDARRTLAGPCSRCRSKNLDCRFDANFKRVSTRKLTEEISHEIHALRSKEQIRLPERFNGITSQEFPLGNKLPETRNEVPSVDYILTATSLEKHASEWPNIANLDKTQRYILGEFSLNPETAVELFEHFGVHYYHYVEFLQSYPSISDLLTRSPLLFWTIILIASQDHAQFAAIYQKVATEHESLMPPILQRAIQQIETIHALLLLCLWPIPQPRHFHNPAWNYIGLAINAAIQLDCHNPTSIVNETNGWRGLGPVAASELSTEDQARTWLGCFWVGTVTATFYGLPPPMSTQQQMRSIDKAFGIISNSTPPWWGTLISILKITTLATENLGGVEDHNLHFSVTQMFDNKLNELRKANSDHWRSELEIEWCNAKLYLYALTFIVRADTNISGNIQIQIHCQKVLHQSLEVSTKLITELKRLGQASASDIYPGGLLSFVPKPYFTALFNAVTFIFRFMATGVGRTTAQESLAMGLIVEAHKIFQSFPEQRELTRAAIHIEMFIDVLRHSTSVNMNELVVNNKLGASVMFDAVFHACQQRNRDPSTGRVTAVRDWKTVNETFAQRLPGVPIEKTGNDATNLNAVIQNESGGVGSVQQSSTSSEQNPPWWGEWDNYIDLFQVGDEQGNYMDMDQIMVGNDSLEELRAFMYT